MLMCALQSGDVGADVAHPTPWLGSTGERGVVLHQAGEKLLTQEPHVSLMIIWTKQRDMLLPDNSEFV